MYRDLSRKFNISIEYHDEVTSTNDLARSSEHPPGSIIVAERQTSGRGQRGNKWESPAGENLTFSVVLHPEFLRADMQFYISKAVSLSLCDVLDSLGLTAKIKWPNDIYIGNKKIAGILIENDIINTNISKSIIGIGLNVNQEQFDPALPNPSSVLCETGHVSDRAEVLKRIIICLSKRYGQLPGEEYDVIDSDYHSCLYRAQEEYPYYDVLAGSKFRGIIRSVKPTGELVVEHIVERTAEHIKEADSERTGPHIKYYLFKEIEFR